MAEIPISAMLAAAATATSATVSARSAAAASRAQDAQAQALDEEKKRLKLQQDGQDNVRLGGRGLLAFIEDQGLGKDLGSSSTAGAK